MTTAQGEAPETIARLPIDLRVAREALLNVDGPSGSFTEIGEAAFARIERARAALVSKRYLNSARVLLSSTAGTGVGDRATDGSDWFSSAAA